MATPRRIARLESLLKQEISQILLHRVNDPRMGFVSVMRAELSKDCKHLKVNVSVMGSRADKTKVMHALGRAKNFIAREAMKPLRLRVMPEISFALDESIEKGFEICKIIDRISEESRSRDKKSEAESHSRDEKPEKE